MAGGQSGGHISFSKHWRQAGGRWCEAPAQCSQGAKNSWQQLYEKGDGEKVGLLQQRDGDADLLDLGRGEHGSRFHAWFRVGTALYLDANRYRDLLHDIINTKGAPNQLTSSVYVRLCSMHYDAYLYVTALLWEQVMCELRCRTNSREVGLNPYSLAHDHYEPLLNLATELQSEDRFRIMNEDFDNGFPQHEAVVR